MKIDWCEIMVDQLKHGDKFEVPLGCKPEENVIYQAVSLEVAKLFVDYLFFLRVSQLIGAGCRHKRGYDEWTCCPEHLSLLKDEEALRERARKMLVQPGIEKISTFSKDWWEKLGFNLPDNHAIIS